MRVARNTFIMNGTQCPESPEVVALLFSDLHGTFLVANLLSA
jgi:hypothetical protein